MKFGAIRGVVRSVVIFEVGFLDKIRHQIVSLMSCEWVIDYLLFVVFESVQVICDL